MPRLSDIDPGELSLVNRGANRRPWTVKKSDEQLLPQLHDVLALPVDGDDRFIGELRKTDVDEAAGLAAVGAYRLLKAHADELPGPLQLLLKQMDELECEDDVEPDEDDVEKAYETAIAKKDYSADQRRQMSENGEAMSTGSYPIGDRSDLENAVHAVGRGSAPHADIRAHIVARAKALKATDLLPDSWNVSKEDDMPEGDGALVPVKKDDGSWDVSMLSEEAREPMLAFLKQQDEDRAAEIKKAEDERSELEKRTNEALEIAKAERDTRETREYIAKAEAVGHGEEFGAVLKTVANAVDEATFTALEAVLKASHERAVAAGIFEEIGKNGGGEGGETALEQLEKKAADIKAADSSLTKEQAFAKAMDENPDLYQRYREES